MGSAVNKGARSVQGAREEVAPEETGEAEAPLPASAAANCNECLSVGNPAFVCAYAKHVLPTVSRAERQTLRPFISSYAQLVEQHCSEFVDAFREVADSVHEGSGA